MRTNVVIDDELMAQAMKHTGLKTKRAVIEEALRTLIRLKSQENCQPTPCSFYSLWKALRAETNAGVPP